MYNRFHWNHYRCLFQINQSEVHHPMRGAFIIYKFKRWYFYLQYIHLYIYIFQLPLFLWFNTRIALFLSEVYIHHSIYMFQWPKFLQIHTGIAFFPEVYNHRYIYMFHVPMFLRLRLFLSEVFIHWYIYMFQWPLTQQISCSRALPVTLPSVFIR